MTERTFAPWVAPVAEDFRQRRTALIELVRSIPDDRWSKASPNEGWTYRDLLGHLATRDSRTLRLVLQAVVNKTPLDPAQLPAEEETPINDRLLAELRGRSIEQMVGIIEEDTEEVLGLLASLSADDEHLRQAEFPVSLGEALGMMPQHDRMHMEQLKTATEVMS